MLDIRIPVTCKSISGSLSFLDAVSYKKLAYGTMSVNTHLFWYASGVSTMREELSH